MKKIDIVLQGPYTDFTDEIIERYVDLEFINKIIISCWHGDVPSTTATGLNVVHNKDQAYQHEKVECVRTVNDLYYSGVLNINYQLTTSLAGVKHSKNNICGVIRSDQKYTVESMENFYNFLIENIDKIKPTIDQRWSNKNSKIPKGKIFIMGNNKRYLFHPRAWMFWGYREDLIELYNIPLQVNEEAMKKNITKEILYFDNDYFRMCHRGETYLGSWYCSKYDNRVIKMVENPELYLYDHCPNKSESQTVSMDIMPRLFKSFPRTGIDLYWPKNNVNTFKGRAVLSEELWHEEGM